MRDDAVVNRENKGTVRAGGQIMLATAGGMVVEIDHDTGAGRNLPIRADTKVFDTIAPNVDAALCRGHHRVGEVDDDACWRIERRHFRGQ